MHGFATFTGIRFDVWAQVLEYLSIVPGGGGGSNAAGHHVSVSPTPMAVDILEVKPAQNVRLVWDLPHSEIHLLIQTI